MDSRLSQINTLWTLVGRAHRDEGTPANAAQAALLERYGGAVRRYLLGALRDPEAADELYQDFAYRFLHGDMRGANSQRGRFRDFVKGVLFHMIANYHNRRQRQPRQLAPEHQGPAVQDPSVNAEDEAFLASWRDELLARCWAALGEYERDRGQPFYTVLHFRAEHPDMPSARMAEELSPVLGKPLTAAGVRKTLERAREKFADLLLDEIAQALEDPTPEQLEEELIDLGLFEYCHPALQRRGRPG
jgi:RNA polymerase sigma-70 factor (ECF subfamily)